MLTYCYIWQITSSDNSKTRAALCIALIRDHSPIIDDFARDTIYDRASVGGHFYSDKAPGLSLAALPSMALAYRAFRRFAGTGPTDYLPVAVRGGGPSREPSPAFKALTLIGTMATSAPATALAVALLYSLGRRLGADHAGALIGALSFGLASPALGWSSAFFGHALAGALLFLGFAASYQLVSIDRSRDIATQAWSIPGLLLGYSVLTEYTCAVPAIMIGTWTLWFASRRGRTGSNHCVAGLSLGVLPSALIFLAHNALTVGSPWSLGYQHLSDFPGMRAGVLGITYPKFRVLLEITLMPRHGITWISPILILTPWFFLRYLVRGGSCEDDRDRSSIALAGATVIYFFAVNSSYYYWTGGTCIGPRHVTPCLAFASLPLGPCWTRSGKGMKFVIGLLFGLSLATSGLCALTSMIESVPPDSFSLLDAKVGRLAAGEVHTLPLLAGVRSSLTLIPLLIIWTIAAYLLADPIRRGSVAIAGSAMVRPSWPTSAPIA